MKNVSTKEVMGIINKICTEGNFKTGDEDIDLSQYFDSMQFIYMILELEDAYAIEIPDAMLTFAEMGTITKIANNLSSIL